jgi:hypothetical protein
MEVENVFVGEPANENIRSINKANFEGQVYKEGITKNHYMTIDIYEMILFTKDKF